MRARFSGVYVARAGELDERVRLGLDALVHDLVDDALRRRAAVVAEGFLPAERRQATEVLLDERLERQRVDIADEHEREVARVGKPVLVEGERLLRIHLGERRRA